MYSPRSDQFCSAMTRLLRRALPCIRRRAFPKAREDDVPVQSSRRSGRNPVVRAAPQHYLTSVLHVSKEVDMAIPDKAATTLSTKGQVILPKAIRERRHWGPGTRLLVED